MICDFVILRVSRAFGFVRLGGLGLASYSFVCLARFFLFPADFAASSHWPVSGGYQCFWIIKTMNPLKKETHSL